MIQNDEPQRKLAGLPMTVWLGLALGILATGACLVAVGTTLGLYFGGIIAAALIVPALSLAEKRLSYRFFIAGAVTDGIAIVWLLGLFNSVSTMQWLVCYALLLCWAFALAGLAHALDRMIGNGILASAIVVVIALLWLSWPIWLSRIEAPTLMSIHPLFAVNGILTNLGVWWEQPLAYRYLMVLNQDIPYALPRSIAPAAAVHLLVGALGLLLGKVVGKS